MKIRDALPSDKITVLDFCKDTFSWGDYIADVWDSWILQGKLFVADEKDTPVGICHIYFSQNQVWIEGIRIHAGYRRKGYASNLVLHAESIAQKNSCKIARMVIESENKGSLKLARTLGYYSEDKWRLYYLSPKKQSSSATFAYSTSQVVDLLSSDTYADSWKWLPLEKPTIKKLIDNKRVLISIESNIVLAAAIWNESEISAKTLQIGFINGTQSAMKDILQFMQNLANKLDYERIQIFAQEKVPLQMEGLDKRSLFELMRKELN